MKKAFTMIEVIFVLVILGILSATVMGKLASKDKKEVTPTPIVKEKFEVRVE